MGFMGVLGLWEGDCRRWSREREVGSALVGAVEGFGELEGDVGEQTAGAEAEPIGGEPCGAEGFLYHDEVLEGFFRGWENFVQSNLLISLNSFYGGVLHKTEDRWA